MITNYAWSVTFYHNTNILPSRKIASSDRKSVANSIVILTVL